MMAYILAITMNHESRSALPDAPIIVPVEAARRAGRASGSLARLQGWLASALHRAAWAIEPEPRAVTESPARSCA
jgi:hypothetical protein